MKQRLVAGLVAVLTALILVVFAKPASANPEYIDCMDHAITHKYAQINSGVSYGAAHSHYLYHTQRCYRIYYGDGVY